MFDIGKLVTDRMRISAYHEISGKIDALLNIERSARKLADSLCEERAKISSGLSRISGSIPDRFIVDGGWLYVVGGGGVWRHYLISVDSHKELAHCAAGTSDEQQQYEAVKKAARALDLDDSEPKSEE